MELRAENGFAAAAGWQHGDETEEGLDRSNAGEDRLDRPDEAEEEPHRSDAEDVLDRSDDVLELRPTPAPVLAPVPTSIEEPEPESGNGLWRILAVTAVIAWLGLAFWLVRPRLGVMTGTEAVQFAAALCAVPILIVGLWLLAQRNSRAEARRFGLTAQAMRGEAARLEGAVAALSRAIDANSAKLAEQVDILMAMGENAAVRLSGIEREVGAEIARVDEHARRVAEAAANAKAGVDTLLDALPRAREAIETTAEALDRAGRSSLEHGEALEGRFAELAERGREADTIANGSAQALAAHIARMELTADGATGRLEAAMGEMTNTVDMLVERTAATINGARDGIAAQGEATVATLSAHQTRLDRAARESTELLAQNMETALGEMSDTVDALVERTATTISGARDGIAAQGEATVAALSAHQARLDRAARESTELLTQRMMSVEQLVERVSDRLEAQRASGDLIVEHLQTGIGDVEERLNRLHGQGSERAQTLAASISALGGSAEAMTEALRAGDDMATRTIGTTESLLIALDAATREIDETLPEALGRLDDRIAVSKRLVGDAKPELMALVTAAESTHDAIEAVAGVIAEQRRTLEQLSGQLMDTLSHGRAKADALGHTVEEAMDRTRRFAEEAAPQLVQSLLRVRDGAAQAAESARATLAAIVPDAASRLEKAGAEALNRAAADTVERQVQALGEATEAAAEAAERAAARVARETQAIVDHTAIVEARIEQARDEREEASRNSIARRVSTLVEALNSASIDVAKVLNAEVADSSWAAYLKGDRGVFTRRAVRLLDVEDARRVGELYDDNEDFRASVNRYIHDFETMLRVILTQPEGTPLSITLLSSDMGKLYVALAQAIERLR